MPRHPRFAAPFALAGLLLAPFVALLAAPAHADEGWTIRSFDVTYDIDSAGIVHVTEDIVVDFGTLQKHGIFREMPLRYQYDDDNDRVISVGNVVVDNGDEAWEFSLSYPGANLQIKIGDPDVEVSGVQRYRITYVLTAALNPFADHDEFYWNVTGDDWPVPIQSASAQVTAPSGSVQMTDCFQGSRGSTERCESTSSSSSATFTASRELSAGEGMTLVLGLEKGAIEVGPPVLKPSEPDPFQEFEDAFAVTPLTVAGSLGVLVLGVGLVLRQWWVQGRDRWYGEVWYHNDGTNALGRRKPLMATETVLTEFEPPPLDKDGRHLRPAEIGVLMDESADTLDVTATIVDLAVRKHIRIKETKSGGFLGLFKSTDYEIERLGAPDEELLPYELQTRNALFKGEGSTTVKLSSLKNKFYKDLEKIKDALYDQAAKKDGLFPRRPDSARTVYRVAGLVVGGVGVLLAFLLWSSGGTFLAVAFIAVGALVLLMAPLMSRRTAKGRALYLRSLGFRKFMVTAETERQRFAERANIFHEYLPYAMIFGCVGMWAKAFEGLGAVESPDWYVGSGPFVAASFADSLSSFSSSISSSIASTPGGSGGSGFGGGGSSGGGGGGGGGGSW